MVQNKFQQEDSDSLLSPDEIANYYENAVNTPFENSETFVLIITNKKITKTTKEMLERGKITTTKEKKVDTEKLILVSGDCFDHFFHPFIANVMHGHFKSLEFHSLMERRQTRTRSFVTNTFLPINFKKKTFQK